MSLVALALAVVGCAGNPQPSTIGDGSSPATPSTSAAPTSTPTPAGKSTKKSSTKPAKGESKDPGQSDKGKPDKGKSDKGKSDKNTSDGKDTSDHGKVVVKGGGKAGPAADTIEKLARQFLDADNHASKTGDYTARDKLTSPSCDWCAQKKSYVEKIYTGGGKVTGELFTHNRIDVQGPRGGKYYAVITTTVSKYKEVDGNGRVIDSHGDRTGLLSLTYAKSGSSWKVVEGSWSPNS